MLEVGTLIHLDGKTVKGKNRINRGGRAWMVKAALRRRDDPDLVLVESILPLAKPEAFWMNPINDPHVRRLIHSE